MGHEPLDGVIKGVRSLGRERGRARARARARGGFVPRTGRSGQVVHCLVTFSCVECCRRR